MNQDNEIISYFKRAAQSVRLTLAERDHIKNHIIFSPYLFHSTFWTYKRLVSVVAVLALIITSGGTSFAAASSLPGDTLYGVKVNVNEEVQSIIAISPDAKVKVAADRVKERLNEADKLSARGDLTPAKQAIIKTNIKRHTEALKANIAAITSDDEKTDVQEANQVIDDLKTSLDEHEVSLESQSNLDASTTVAVSSKSDTKVATSTSNDKLGDIISGVIEAKAEIETLQKSLDDKSEANGTSTVKVDGTATTTATTTISSTIDINASSTSTTTKDADAKSTNHPILHYRFGL